MKTLFICLIPVLLSGCHALRQVEEQQQAVALTFQCDEGLLTIQRYDEKHQLSVSVDDNSLILMQGHAGDRVLFTDGIYTLLSQKNGPTLYHRDWTVRHNCRTDQNIKSDQALKSSSPTYSESA